MTTQYDDAQLDIDEHRWYFTRFCVQRYRKEVDWDTVKAKFDRTAEALESLIQAYLSAGVFGDEELTALKSTTQLESTIGREKTRKQMLQTRGTKDDLERAAKLITSSKGKGIVTGLPYPASVGGAEDKLLDLFETLLDADTDVDEYDRAAEELLELDLENVGVGTITAILCLLHPTRYPILNSQTKNAFASCFDIELSGSTYFSDISYFEAVRDDFDFEDYFRHLDYYCYWIREEKNIETYFLENGVQNRDTWQINAGVSDQNQPERLWPLWRELGICSIGWDIGPLDGLSDSELNQANGRYEQDLIGDYFRRFRDEIEPGQIIIAKDGAKLLGIGVVEQGGYHYCGDLIDERIEGERVGHPHVLPVSWEVVSDGKEWKTNEWGLSTGLSARPTLVRTTAFEEIRCELARLNPDQINALSGIEEIVSDPPIASLPEECQSEVSEENYFILRTGSDEWEDEPAERYHFREPIAGYDQLTSAGIAQVVYLEDGEFYATARVTAIEQEEREDHTHYFANISEYEEIKPVPLDDIRGELEKSISWQHSIIELDENDFTTIVEREFSPRYFWVNSGTDSWYHKGGSQFYTRTTSEGRNRNNQPVYDRLRPGDELLVFRVSQAIVGRGHVEKGLHEEYSEQHGEAVEGITIAWDEPINDVTKSQIFSSPVFDKNFPNKVDSYVITELSEVQYQTILERSEVADNRAELEASVAKLRERLSPPAFSVDLPDNLYFENEDELQRQIQASLNSGKHIIFTGPPGTGKTKLAVHTCQRVRDEHEEVVDGYRFTTATAEWTTFDTIGGYVPNRSAEGDELVFQPRLFLGLFRDDEGIKNDWLVIDEINRSDIDKAFGQLFSVLSGDSVELPYERDSPLRIESVSEPVSDDKLTKMVENPDTFPVTPSWRLLATMNTFDKTSLYELSYAFMRRFNFIHVGVPPLSGEDGVRTSLLNPDNGPNYATTWELEQDSKEMLDATFEQLAVIWAKVNNHQTIGPSIMRDMLGYLVASGPETRANPGPALTDAVIALVFPQLEGLPPQQTWELIETLDSTGVSTENGNVDLELEGGRLERKAEDFFNLPQRDDG